MDRNRDCIHLLLGLALLSSSLGCQAIGRSPLGFRSRQTSIPAEVVANQSGDTTSGANVTAAVEDASQQVARESRALSDKYAAPQDPELAKFANSPGADASLSASSSAGSGVTTSSANSSGSRCTNGCCH